MCEINPVRQKLLAKNFGTDVPIFVDMKELPSGAGRDYNRGGGMSAVPEAHENQR